MKGKKPGISHSQTSNKKTMRCTRPSAKIDQAARHARGFRRFDADLAGECGHLLINQEILSNSPFGRTTQTVVAFQRQHKGPSARVLIF